MSDGMMFVALKTGGEHVAYGKVPPFKTKPKVMCWGARVFVDTGETESRPDGRLCDIYEEDCMWHVLETDEYGPTFPTVDLRTPEAPPLRIVEVDDG